MDSKEGKSRTTKCSSERLNQTRMRRGRERIRREREGENHAGRGRAKEQKIERERGKEFGFKKREREKFEERERERKEKRERERKKSGESSLFLPPTVTTVSNGGRRRIRNSRFLHFPFFTTLFCQCFLPLFLFLSLS